MKRNLLLAGLVLLAAVACKKEEQGGGDNEPESPSSSTYRAKIELDATQNWEEGTAMGVYTAEDFNSEFTLTEGAGTLKGAFYGEITKGTAPLCAYMPYDAEAGDNMTAVPVNIPTNVAQGADMELYRFQAAASDLRFYDKLSTLKVSFSNVEGGVLDGKTVSSITLRSARKIVGKFTANLTQPQGTAIAETYESSNTVTLTFPNGTSFNKDLVGYASIAPYIKAGTQIDVTLLVDGKTFTGEIQASGPSEEGAEYAILIDAGLFEPKMELVWAYGKPAGDQELKRPQGNVPAVDNNGNVYVITSGFNKVVKINSNGTKAWAVDAAFGGNCQFSPSVEADGSVVYVGGGKNTDAKVLALNASDGSVKWTFGSDKFFAAPDNTLAPDLGRRVMPAITSKAVYIGNGGTTGTVIAIDKATGDRLSFVANNGATGGPAGGCNVGVAITKGGYAAWSASWGAYSAKTSLMEAPTLTSASGAYAPWCSAWRVSALTYGVSVSDGLAALTLDGEDYFAFYVYQSSSQPDLYLVCAKATSDATFPGASTSPKMVYKFAGAQKQDQGGIVIGPRNEIIASLKHNSTLPGGVYAVDPATGNLLWKYTVGADVGGAAAVDNNGYVHVMSDDGVYHIVQPNYSDGTAKVIYKDAMVNILKQSSDYSDTPKVGSWSSPVIGNDGKIYVYIPTFQADGSSDGRYGVVMCMQYAPCTGPGNTSWPMKGADARHSGNQK